MIPKKRKDRKIREQGFLFRRVVYVLSVALAVLPLLFYLVFLPNLPDMLPVKYDEMGLPSIDVSKTSVDMILFSLTGVFGVGAMLIAGGLAQGFAKRTYKKKGLSSTKSTLAFVTFVISILTCLSWFITILPLMN